MYKKILILFFYFILGNLILASKNEIEEKNNSEQSFQKVTIKDFPEREELPLHLNKIQSVRHSNWESFLIGTGAGAIETFVNHPLWVWKTRAQYGDYFTINPKIIYKGVFARVITMSGIIATRVMIRDSILRYAFNEDTPSFTHNSLASFLGGAFSSPLSSSLELILTQQQKNFQKKEFSSFRSTFFTMKTLRGIKIFSTGLPCSIIRDGSINLFFLCITPYIKYCIEINEDKKNTIKSSIISGLFSGGLAAIVSNPFDTIKSIQQSEVLINEREIRKAIKISLDLWKNEGLKGFYKGFFWRGMRLTTGIPILFYSTEILTELYHEKWSDSRLNQAIKNKKL